MKIHGLPERFILEERQNHNRFVPGTGNRGFLTMRFDAVDNFGKLFGRTVIGKSFHRVTSRYWGVRIVLKDEYLTTCYRLGANIKIDSSKRKKKCFQNNLFCFLFLSFSANSS